MIGLLGRLEAAATLGQHCPQMTQRRCMPEEDACLAVLAVDPAGRVALREVQRVGGHGHHSRHPPPPFLTGKDKRNLHICLPRSSSKNFTTVLKFHAKSICLLVTFVSL